MTRLDALHRDSLNAEILFSLTPGSPTLTANGWGPGDVLKTTNGGSPSKLYDASELGLAATDDLTALCYSRARPVRFLPEAGLGDLFDLLTGQGPLWYWLRTRAH